MQVLKKIRLLTAAVLAVGFSLYAGVLAPLYVQLSSDVAYSQWLCQVVFWAWETVDLLMFFWAYAATAYTWYRGGLKPAVGLAGIYGGLVLYKYAANFVIGSLVDGAFPSWESFVALDLPIIGGEIAWELGQYALIVLLAALILSKSRKEKAQLFPFARTVDMTNPMQRWALSSAVVVTVIRWAMHLLYQLTLLVKQNRSEGWLVISVDLVSDLLIGVIAYFAMVFILSTLDRMDQSGQKKEKLT